MSTAAHARSVRLSVRASAVVLLLSALAMPAVAGPLTFSVNSLEDAVDANPGDGVCETAHANHVCTLRAAIQEANAHPGADTIVLQPNVTYVLTIPGLDDAAAKGDLDITDDVSIVGAGADSTIINGNGSVTGDRVFNIFNPAVAPPPPAPTPVPPTVSISGVTIENGVSGNIAGGILNSGILTLSDSLVTGNQAIGINNWGGGIFSAYPLTLIRTTVSGNTTGSSNEFGGGIFSQSSLTVIDSTISGNTTPGPGGGIYAIGFDGDITIRNSTISGNHGGIGGGIYHTGGRPLNVVNSTISGNQSNGAGGGIYNKIGTVNLYNATVTQNRANADDSGSEVGGGVANESGQTLTFINSIIAQNQLIIVQHPLPLLEIDDCAGTVLSLGHNIMNTVDPDHCTVSGSVDLEDPQLGPLQDNGGPTQTHALAASSPAIDGGNPLGCIDETGAPLTRDQRGIERPKDGDADQSAVCDVGAYERGKPAKPVLRKPASGATVGARPKLVWKASGGTKKYRLQLQEIGGSTVLDEKVDRTKTKLKAPKLDVGRYSWDVRACDDLGCSKPAKSTFTSSP